MSPLQTFIRRPVFTAVLAVALVVFGLVSFPRIGVDRLPPIEVPIVTVTTLYPGADPETMERDVSEKLEEPLSTISGVEAVRSQNTDSVSVVVVQFDLEKPVAEAAQEVRDKVSATLGKLPKQVEQPVVEKLDLAAAPVVTLGMSSSLPVEQLTRIAKDVVKPQLQRQGGVGQVDVIGGREREIRVIVDPERLRAHGLAISDVAQALSRQNLDTPAGRTLEPGRERIVRLSTQVRTADEVRALVVASPGGVAVHVSEVATVVDGPAEARSGATWDGKSAVAFSIQKQSDANTVEVAHRVKAAMASIERQLPEGTKLSLVEDASTSIEKSISAVQEDLLLGAVLAVVIVLVFLRNWRSTLIAAVALPTSVVGTFAVMHALGFTFNLVTMLGLTLSIGLLVDDAIVVIENIVRKLEQGAAPFEAALSGTREIALAVLAVTLAIVSVFVPVATMRGTMGRVFFQFGITVAVAVLISYAVSMTLTPMMSARLLKAHDRTRQPGRVSRAIERVLERLEAVYGRTVAFLLQNRGKTAVVAVGVLGLTVALVPFLKTTFIPAGDQSALEVALKLPPGANLDRLQGQLADLEAQVRAAPGVRSVFTQAGGGTLAKVNEGKLRVNLVPIADRAQSQQELQALLRERLVVPPGVVVAVQRAESTGGSAGSSRDVQFNLRSADWTALTRSAEELVTAMKATRGFVDVDTSTAGGMPQLDVRLDPDRAAALGVEAASAASALRAYMGGDEVTQLRDGGDSYSVVLALPDSLRAAPDALAGLQVRSATGALVELGNLARLEGGDGPAQIDREARQRQITVQANLDGLSLGEANAWLARYGSSKLPPSVQGEFAGYGKELGKAGSAFAEALFLGILLVFLILSAQFESVVDALAIMASLPFAVIGALGSLLLTRTELSMFAMIGTIMLFGLVAKNGILLVEFARHLKEQGKPTFDALVEAGRVRLRPILMTTIAMIAGMLPAALATGDGAETRAPMAIVIIGGLVTSTALTLGVVPVVYSLLDSLRERVTRRAATGATTPASSPAPSASAP